MVSVEEGPSREQEAVGTAMGISICRITDRRIAEEWATWDALGFLQQIGVIPELVGQAKEKAAG